MTSSFRTSFFHLDHPAAGVRPSLPCFLNMNSDSEFGNYRIDVSFIGSIGRR